MVQINTLLTLSATLKARGMYPRGRSTHYNDIRARLWPSPIRISARIIGWPESEVAAMINARIAGLSDGEIRALVRQIEAARRPGA